MSTTDDLLAQAGYLTEFDKQVIAEVNKARQNPAAYAEVLAAMRPSYNGQEGVAALDEAIAFLRAASPLPPLQPSPGMSMAATDHVNDTGPKGIVSHDGTDGSSIRERIDRYGDGGGYAGENISYGMNSPQDVAAQLIIDDGVPSRGHRENIFNPQYQFIGVDTGSHAQYQTMTVLNFAGQYTEDASVTPVQPPPIGDPIPEPIGLTLQPPEPPVPVSPPRGEVMPEFRRQNWAGITEPANQSFVFADFSTGNDAMELTPETSRQNPGGVRAFDGDDLIVGSIDRDIVNGNRGNDSIQGGEGDDYLRGGQDNDSIEGNGGNDIVNGNKGEDIVDGGAGDDLVRGGQGNDLLIGGDGDDVLIGDFGTDSLTGGAGADKFIIRADTAAGQTNVNLADRITDFGTGDEIVIVGNQEQIQLVASGSDTVIQLSGGDIVALVANVTPENLPGSILAAFGGDGGMTIG
ncbi:CAP domain-containing protein [[Phormidium] sp. ETS-05]|uniref:CAP domain-containing protein n=1 Tax=[Phormidium] sp. ETS-05 TaxID=222819 RepID=UPI0018EF30CD|nr:CAP domain-containing protein [[Phormidium] sp. ETS-05]